MKNLVKSILIGASTGIVILMLSYVGVYHIEGQEVFEKEILQLTQENVLQNQLIVAAFYGALFVTALSITTRLIQNENKTVYKPILGSVLFVVMEIIIIFSMDYIGGFSENIKSMLEISNVLLLGVYLLAKCAMTFLDEFFINKKIKEKNSQEPEKGNE